MAKRKKTPVRFRCPVLTAALAAALLLLALACGERNVYVPPPPPKVTVSQPLKKQVTDYLEFTGNAAAFNTVQLRARVEGLDRKSVV